MVTEVQVSNSAQIAQNGLLAADLSEVGTEVTFCSHCNKPLYVADNIRLFGFDTAKFCRNNWHLDTVVKICR